MKIEQSFEAEASSSETEKRIVTFMAQNGYAQNSGSELTFQRGSRFGSYLSFSPRRWQTQATIAHTQLADERSAVTLTLDINDQGQLVTQHERSYWKAELDEFQRAVQIDESLAASLAHQDRELTLAAWKGLGIFLAVAITAGVGTGLALSFVNPFFRYLGIVAGIASGLLAAKKYWGF